VPSGDPAAAYGLKSGTKRRRKGEEPGKFIERVAKYAPKVIVQCDGDIPVVALVFGVQLEMMEDIITAKKLSKFVAQGRANAAARARGDSEVAAAAKKALLDEVDDKDKRLIRKAWPVDPEQRRSDIHDALCISLIENEGDISETSSCLNVSIDEINEMMEGDEVLLNARARGLQVQATRAESQVFGLMKQGNFQAAKMVLTNLLSDQWSERQQVDVRRVGFAPPDDKDAEDVSVLQLVKGDKGNA
jgi:hypothetical protein